MLIYIRFFFLSDLLNSGWQTLGHPYLYKWPNFISFYGWVIFHCIWVPHFLYPLFFNWRIIALKSCVGFSHISALISHRYTYVPSILNPFPPPTPSHSLGCHQHWVELPLSHSKFPPAIYFTHGSIYVSMLLQTYLQDTSGDTDTENRLIHSLFFSVINLLWIRQ